MQIHIGITIIALVLGSCASALAQAQRPAPAKTKQTSPARTGTSPASTRPPLADRAASVTALPDLVITDVRPCDDKQTQPSSSDFMNAGGCYKFQIKNQGLGEAKSNELGVVFKVSRSAPHATKHNQPIYGLVESFVESVAVPALAPRTEAWITVAGADPKCLHCLTLGFHARIDQTNAIKESDETNNRLTKYFHPEYEESAPENAYVWMVGAPDKITMKPVEAGKHADGTMMYVCKGFMPDGSHPGKLYNGQCYVPWNGKEYVLQPPQSPLAPLTSTYAVLTSSFPDYSWIPFSQLPTLNVKQFAIEGGVLGDGKSGEPLYICRMKLNDGLHAGKLLLSTGTCYVAWNGKELTSTSGFEVLRRNH